MQAHADIELGTCSFFAERPTIDFSKCQKCGTCAALCKHHVFYRTHEGFFTLNLHLCTGCGCCVHVCPTGAISMIHIPGLYTHG